MEVMVVGGSRRWCVEVVGARWCVDVVGGVWKWVEVCRPTSILITQNHGKVGKKKSLLR